MIFVIYFLSTFLFDGNKNTSTKQTQSDNDESSENQPLYLRDIETIQYDLSNYIFRQPKYWEYLHLKDPNM